MSERNASVKIIASLLFAVLAIKLLALSPVRINADCAMYLQAGAMILSGKIPYRDLFDINPPLVFYVHAIPVALADLLLVDRVWFFNLFLFLTCILSWFVLTLLPMKLNGLLRLSPALLLATPLICWIANDWGEFGQRQLILSIWLIPFVLIRFLRYNGQSVRGLIAFFVGCFYGIAICLIPQYLIIGLSLELFWLFRFKQIAVLFATENIMAAVIAVIYAAFFLLHPAITRPFFLHNLPLVARGYAAYDWPVQMILLSMTLSGILPLVALSLIVKIFLKKERNPLFLPFFIWTIAALLAVLVQGKCYPNQLLPAAAGSICLWLVAITDLQDGQTFRWIFMAIVLPALALIPFQWRLFEDHTRQSYINGAVRDVIARETKSGDKVAVFSISLPDSFPLLLEMHRTSCGPYFFLYPLKMLKYLQDKARSKAETEFIEQEKCFTLARICQTIEDEKPVLLLIQDANAELSVSRFLEHSEEFKRILKNYVNAGDCQGRDLLHVYKLKRV